jgi:hypothetical protein
MERLRIAVVGSRDWPSPVHVLQVLQDLPCDEIAIISGGARGVDTFAADWAKRKGVPLTVFDADWDTHGKAAGPIRNTAIVEAAEVVIAFVDGPSKGTKDAIKKAKAAGKQVVVYTLEGGQLKREVFEPVVNGATE